MILRLTIVYTLGIHIKLLVTAFGRFRANGCFAELVRGDPFNLRPRESCRSIDILSAGNFLYQMLTDVFLLILRNLLYGYKKDTTG